MLPPGLSLRGFRTQRVTPVTEILPGAGVSQASPIASTVQNLLPATTPLPVTTAAPAAPAASAAGNLLSTVGKGAVTAGKAIVNNPGTALSILQGVGGAISYATAQAPKPLSAPAAYTPPIRPAQGIEASSYAQARQDLLGTQTVASGADTSDVAGGVVQRLLAQRQTNQGLVQLAGSNNQAYQQDAARVNQQEAAAYGINYQNQRQFAENQFNQQNRQYEARRTQTAAQVQGAVDSIAGNYQVKQQQQQTAIEGKNRRAEADITALHTALAGATTPEQKAALLARLKQLDPEGVRYQQAETLYGVPKKLAGGGSIPNGFVQFKDGKAGKAGAAGKAKKAVVPASVTEAHKMSAEFGRHLNRFSSQARAAFDRSLNTAIRLRSTPFGGRTGR